MTTRDLRCLFSGVSLWGAETALVLLGPDEGALRPISLPLLGRYLGHGLLEDITDGPNCALILAALQKACDEGALRVDWQGLGVEPTLLEDLQSFLSLVAYAQLSCPDAIVLHDHPLQFALLEANVLAALVARPTTGLDDARLDELPSRVFGGRNGAATLYRALASQPLALRLRFGQSLLGLYALERAFEAEGLSWSSPGGGWERDDGRAASWLEQALLRFRDQLDVIEALDEYSQGTVEDEL